MVLKSREQVLKDYSVAPLRADIDFSTYEAHTTYGVIGIKVWIFKGEILGGIEAVRASREQARAKAAR